MTRKKNEKHSEILKAALEVFAENGFHRSQVSKIANTAGVAQGTIYLYFKRKEDILIALFQEIMSDLVAKFTVGIQESKDVREALHKICHIHYSEMEGNVNLALVTQIELFQSDRELRKTVGETVKPYIKLIEELLLKGIEQGLFRPSMDVKLVRLLLFGAMDEVVTSWLISGRKYSLAAQTEGTIDFFLNGISK
ncbi:transcriptional regulator, TetR family [Paenibacillus sp. yr247]|uniref:TetR/AcrR family transcriptional regulator n=1 Tax=Paenibacillus sp. yr247 TaxID=1761880 RepID=UPI00087F2899|nr:TetR/AcrR family transcriptional regulator [Paenibacillus sp. yr247]SDN70335.1 transcriptional regulator, TetR family [Paenibacillus sp. yr247]